MKLHQVFPRSRVLLSSAFILALYATPVTYDFEHGQWQAKGAYADDDECDDDCGVDVAISLGDDAVIILGDDDYDHGHDYDDDDDDRGYGYGYDDNDDDDDDN